MLSPGVVQYTPHMSYNTDPGPGFPGCRGNIESLKRTVLIMNELVTIWFIHQSFVTWVNGSLSAGPTEVSLGAAAKSRDKFLRDAN